MSNIPSPVATRGRIARPTNTSRIPGTRRESGISGIRCTSRTGGDAAVSTPRRASRSKESTIPTPRRTSRPGANESSIPTPRRVSRTGANESSILTPRRVSRTGGNESSLPTPRRSSRPGVESSIATPRRISRNGESGIATPPRRVSRTAGESGIPTPTRRVSRTPGESSIPGPRRTSRTATESSIPTPRRLSRPSENGTRRTSGLRSSSSQGGLRAPSTSDAGRAQRDALATSPYRRVTPVAEASGKRSAARDRLLPDRTTGGFANGATASRHTPVPGHASVSRQPLKQSPYTRRTSTSGATRGAGGQQVSRKLNMASEEENISAPPGKRVLSGISPVRRANKTKGETPVRRHSNAGADVARVTRNTMRSKTPNARNVSPRKNASPVADRMGVSGRVTKRTANTTRNILSTKHGVIDRGFPTDRVEKQKPLGVNKRPSGSALESFRAVRRASLESEHANPTEQHCARVSMEEQPEREDAIMTDADDLPSGKSIQELQKDALPDRPNPIFSAEGLGTAGQTRTPGKPFRRTSARFSDANVCLDDVEKLRTSLGRRRSRNMGDGEAPETPQLRRSSLTRSIMQAAAAANDDVEMKDSESNNPGLFDVSGNVGFPARAPLQSIQTNKGSFDRSPAFGLRSSAQYTSKRRSIVPNLDGEEWENEDVEDLGI